MSDTMVRRTFIAIAGVLTASALVARFYVPPRDAFEHVLDGIPIPHTDSARATRPSGSHAPLQAGDALDLRFLLESESFDSLEKRFGALRAAADSDVAAEDALFIGYDVLSQPGRAASIMTWRARHPESVHARLTQANMLINTAYSLQDSDVQSSRSDQQTWEMDRAIDSAATALRLTLIADPDALTAYLLLMDLANFRKRPGVVLTALHRALHISPLSALARRYALPRFRPRWGGSYELMGEIADVSDTLARLNPPLAALKGFIDWDLANVAFLDDDTAQATAYADLSLRFGPSFLLCNEKAYINWQYDRLEEALPAAECAVAHRPSDAESHYILSDVSYGLGRKRYPTDSRDWFGRAFQEARLAYTLDSTDASIRKHWRFMEATLPIARQ